MAERVVKLSTPMMAVEPEPESIDRHSEEDTHRFAPAPAHGSLQPADFSIMSHLNRCAATSAC
jgi:hypothetical protein